MNVDQWTVNTQQRVVAVTMGMRSGTEPGLALWLIQEAAGTEHSTVNIDSRVKPWEA